MIPKIQLTLEIIGVCSTLFMLVLVVRSLETDAIFSAWTILNTSTQAQENACDPEKPLSKDRSSVAKIAIEKLHGLESGRNNFSLAGIDASGINFSRVQLKSADLRFANLDGSLLDDANLENANMGTIHLQGACLRNANLAKANLAGALLNNATFQGANLTNANLQGADLFNTIFKDAILKNADLEGALVMNSESDNYDDTIAEQFGESHLCNTTMPNGEISNRDC